MTRIVPGVVIVADWVLVCPPYTHIGARIVFFIYKDSRKKTKLVKETRAASALGAYVALGVVCSCSVGATPLPPVMAGFFSANPALAFECKSSFVDTCRRTTVLYNARTRKSLAGAAAGSVFPVVHTRALKNCLHVTLSPATTETTPEYSAQEVGLDEDKIVAEVLQLFFRGHSMYHEHCRCPPRVHTSRREHLQVSSHTGDEECIVRRQRSFSSAELAADLGCADLDALCCAYSVHTVLLRCGYFSLDGDRWRTHRVVLDQSSLLWFLLLHPFGVDTDDWFIQYPALAADLAQLRLERVVIMLQNSTGGTRVFVDAMRLHGTEAAKKYRIV